MLARAWKTTLCSQGVLRGRKENWKFQDQCQALSPNLHNKSFSLIGIWSGSAAQTPNCGSARVFNRLTRRAVRRRRNLKASGLLIARDHSARWWSKITIFGCDSSTHFDCLLRTWAQSIDEIVIRGTRGECPKTTRTHAFGATSFLENISRRTSALLWQDLKRKLLWTVCENMIEVLIHFLMFSNFCHLKKINRQF